MTVISAKDLDAQMGRTIDPNSVPKHDGATKGVMQGLIQNPSDTVVVDRGSGQRGSAVYGADEIPQKGFYGSSTIISVNDSPPLEVGMEPKPVPVPGQDQAPMQHQGQQAMGPKGAGTFAPPQVLVPPKPKVPVMAPPTQAPQRPQRQQTAVELLSRMGLKPKP